MKLVCLAFGVLVISLIIGCGGGGGTGGTGTSGGGADIGRIYYSEGGTHARIVRMDNIQGDNWTSFGSFGGGTNELNSPRGIAFDSKGRIYIADFGNDRIVRINDFSGAGWSIYGTSGSGVGQFHKPNKLFIDANDRIYISDYENDRIVRIDNMSGDNWVEYGTSGTGAGHLNGPAGIWVDAQHIYICDNFNERIVRIENMSGLNWTEFTNPGLEAPNDIRIYGDKMLINDRNRGIIRTNLMSATGWQEILLHNSQSSCMGTSGKIYAVDQVDDLVWQFPSMAGGTPTQYGLLGQNELQGAGHITFGP
jgi:streptogramin lyase